MIKMLRYYLPMKKLVSLKMQKKEKIQSVKMIIEQEVIQIILINY